jgi:hypothetical protein
VAALCYSTVVDAGMQSLHQDNFYPYQLQRVEHLFPLDKANSAQICEWQQSRLHITRDILFMN